LQQNQLEGQAEGQQSGESKSYLMQSSAFVVT
jgi:hypothetical protein